MKQKMTLGPQWARDLLEKNILPFWCDQMVDETHGGFYGQIDGHGVLHAEVDKSVILNTRILWAFSVAHGTLQKPAYIEMADRAYGYLRRHFVDKAHGGLLWTVDFQGHPVQTKKQVYAQAFGIYAFSEYYKVRPKPEVLDLCIALFELIEDHAFDRPRNGYLEALDRAWQPIDDVRLSEKDINATKTMNTHLHVLEAYTNLLPVWPSQRLSDQLRNLLLLMMEKFVDAGDHFHLFFDDDWQLLSQKYSYGHDIEGSWLLVEAAEVLKEEDLMTTTRETSTRMVEAALEGLDDDGGLMNEGDADGPIDRTKDWWPQAEALVGLASAWQWTGDERYLGIAARVAHFIESHLLNPTGEWYWGVDHAGQPMRHEDKAGPWKCPYHNTRSMIELMRRLI